MFSLPCPDPVRDEGFVMEKIRKDMPTDHFLREVRARLLMVESKLMVALKDDEDEDESNSSASAFSSGPSHAKQLESRFVVCLLLLKVSVQLNLKKESSTHLSQITSIRDQLIAQPVTQGNFNQLN